MTEPTTPPRTRSDVPSRTRFGPLARGLLLVAAIVPLASVADQRSEALPELFDNLLEAEDAAIAARLESLIWQEWFTAPDDDAGVMMSRLNRAMQTPDLDAALEAADALIARAPEFAEAWNRRATIHYLRGDDDESVADIRETLALEPRHFGAISGLGLIFLRRGDLEAALDAFEQVLEISPASANARRSVERVRGELGREI